MPVNKPSGKKFLKEQIAANQDKLRDLYVKGGDAFVKDSLYYYLLSLLAKEPGEPTDEKLFSGGVRSRHLAITRSTSFCFLALVLWPTACTRV